MSLAYGLLLIVFIFIVLFYYLIQSKKLNFQGKDRWVQLAIVFNIIITLLLIISVGIGIITYLFIVLLLGSGGFYYLYKIKYEKIGFIGSLFCSFFLFVFLVLQLWIYGVGI